MPNKQKEKPFDWEGGLDKHIKNSIEVYGCNFPPEIKQFIRQLFSNQNKRLNEAFEEKMNRALERQREEIKGVIEWLLGYKDFPQRQEGEGAYYWRSYLRKKLEKTEFADILKEINKL